MMKKDVLLKSERPPMAISHDHIYFAFASGRLGYDCHTCGAQCCRGHGYEVAIGPELQVHLDTSHALHLFLTPCDRGASHYHVTNAQPGCFFLTREGLCGIHAASGMSAKPDTCRLFPFNRFCLAGDYLVVSPHSSLCPLDVLPWPATSELSMHTSLANMMESHGVGAHCRRSELTPRDCHFLVELEQCILRKSEEAIERSDTYVAFAAAQLVATDLSIDLQSAERQLQAFLQHLAAVLEVNTPDVRNTEVSRTLIGATGALRAEFVFRPRDTGHKPRSRLELDLIPCTLVTLHTILALARTAGMQTVTYQTISQLFTEYQALLEMLAYLDRVVAWRSDMLIDLRFSGTDAERSDYVRIMKRLLPTAQRRHPLPLHTVLCSNMSSRGVARMAFLKRLAHKVSGRLAPVNCHSPGTQFPRSRSHVQQWALSHLKPEYLAGTRLVRG